MAKETFPFFAFFAFLSKRKGIWGYRVYVGESIYSTTIDK